MLRRLLPLRAVDRPTDRAGVDAEIDRDRFHRVGAGYRLRYCSSLLVAVRFGKRLQRLGNQLLPDMLNPVEGRGSPQSRLHAGYKIFTTQVNRVPNCTRARPEATQQ
jgi:hypothetical protein